MRHLRESKGCNNAFKVGKTADVTDFQIRKCLITVIY